MARNKISITLAAFLTAFLAIVATAIFTQSPLYAQDTSFHNAPATAAEIKNPYKGQAAAAQAGANLYQQKCKNCHGEAGKGSGNIPALATGPAQSAPGGEVFWFIAQGDPGYGMPSWAALSEKERWQLVTYIKALGTGHAPKPQVPPSADSSPNAKAESNASAADGASPNAPFTDYRYEKPGTVRKITVRDLPQPYATQSANNSPDIIHRRGDAWPSAPAGFTVQLYANGLNNPRLITTAPNGDFFLAESDAGDIKVFRGITADGKPQANRNIRQRIQAAIRHRVLSSRTRSAMDLHRRPRVRRPHPLSEWRHESARRPTTYRRLTRPRRPLDALLTILLRRQNNVRSSRLRLERRRPRHASWREKVAPTSWRSIRTARTCASTPTASATPAAAWPIDPKTGELWCSVNERDGLGDNLVPDYITHVQEGGFYGWPW